MSHETLYSLKEPTHWLWRTNVSREQVLKQLEETQITGDWLICPLGEAHRSMTVERFVADPRAFQPKRPSEPSMKAKEPTNEGDPIDGRMILLFFFLAWFNLVAIGFVEVLGEIAVVVIAAVIYAQIGLVATWGVFSSRHFTRRLAVTGGVGFALYGCLAMGLGPAGANEQAVRTFSGFLLFCPLLLFAVQSPLWAARIWFRCEIARTSEPPAGSYLRPPGIIDLIIGTAAIGVALAAAKVGPLIADPGASEEVVVYFVVAAGIAGAASLATVTPLVLITLGPRHITSVFIGMAVWYGIVVSLLMVLSFATSNANSISLQASVVGPGIFAAVMCAGLFIVRAGEYRLRRR